MPVGPARRFLAALFEGTDCSPARCITGAQADFGTLVLLPVIWIAMHGSWVELAYAVVGTALDFFIPAFTYGESEYAVSAVIQDTAVWVIVATLVVVTVQNLVRRVQLRAAEEAELARQAADSNEQFDQAFDNAPICMALADLSGRVTRIIECFCAMLGRHADDIVGEPLTRFTDPANRLVLEGADRRKMMPVKPLATDRAVAKWLERLSPALSYRLQRLTLRETRRRATKSRR